MTIENHDNNQNDEATEVSGIAETDDRRRKVVILAGLALVAVLAIVAGVVGITTDHDRSITLDTEVASGATEGTTASTTADTPVTNSVAESPLDNSATGSDVLPNITGNTGGASGGTTGGTNGGTSGGSSGGSTGQHWEQVRCPNGLVGSVVVPDGQSASQEQVNFICSQTFPTTPPTTAPPLTITYLVPGYANAHGSPGPWQQAYCNYRWGLELSDGRVIWRSMTHSVPESGHWSTTISSDPEFGAYPWSKTFQLDTQIVNGSANYLVC